jgi:heme exporter protein D
MNIAALAAFVWLSYTGALPLLAPLVPIALVLLALRSAKAIREGVADRANMTRAIESTLAIHTVGSLWLLGCVLFQHWWS